MRQEACPADPISSLLRLSKPLSALVKNPSIMVGVPGKSKGCTTCRRRKVRVSTLFLILCSSKPLTLKAVRPARTILQDMHQEPSGVRGICALSSLSESYTAGSREEIWARGSQDPVFAFAIIRSRSVSATAHAIQHRLSARTRREP